MRAILCHSGKQQLNFEELKKLGHHLSTLAGISRPGRDAQRRRELFVGWLNFHQALFEPYLCNLAIFRAMCEPTTCQNDSAINALGPVFPEDDETFDETFDWAS
jgi:hypothetical protein